MGAGSDGNRAGTGGGGRRDAGTLALAGRVLGWCLLVAAALFAIVALSMAGGGHAPSTLALAVAIAALFAAGGAMLLALARRVARVAGAGGAPGPETPPQEEGAKGPDAGEPASGGGRVPSGPRQAEPPEPGTDLPAAQDAPAPAAGKAAGGAPPADEDAEAVAALVMRSEDVFATLKDLVRHEYGLARPSGRHLLATMLEASGLMGWGDAPTCGAGRLTRTSHYWVRADVDQLPGGRYDTLVSVEAALGLSQDLPAALRERAAGDADVEAAFMRLLDEMVDQEIPPYDFERDLACAYPGVARTDAPQEWVVRVGVAQAAECARTPFRVVYDQQSNVSEGLAMLALETPRPHCFALVASSPQRQAALARSYALRLAALLGRQALSLTDRLREVQVVCYEHGGSDTLLALRLTRESLARLKDALHAAAGVLPEPDDATLRVRVGANGWLSPVEPFGLPGDPRAYPPERRTYPELNPLLSRPALAAATGAAHVCDLGINESAGRHAAWDILTGSPWATTTEAVAALVSMRDATDDITVAEACSRTAEALVAGSVEATDLAAVHALFVEGTALDQASRRAAALLGAPAGEGGDPAAAVATLEPVLAPIDAVGAYLDDADTIYRYFGSVAERICFNRDLDNRARAVRLVPDAYFDAKGHLATAYIELGRLDEALATADEMIRLAPASAFAVLRKVRALETQSRIFEAADLIRGALGRAWTPRDAAVCHYRLAYMEWKLGREDVAVACYQRALRWNTDVSAQAQAELADLLAASPQLRSLAPDQADALLAREGIPLGCTEGDQRRILAAAVTCCDEGVFRIARPLAGILFSIEGDDVMMGAYRSLVV